MHLNHETELKHAIYIKTLINLAFVTLKLKADLRNS